MINYTHYYWYSVLHVYSIKNGVTIERNTTSSVQMVRTRGFHIHSSSYKERTNISVSTQVSQTNEPTAVADAGFVKGGVKERQRAEILATPPKQLELTTWTTTEHAHTNAASAILCQVHMQLSRRLSNCLSSLLVYSFSYSTSLV